MGIEPDEPMGAVRGISVSGGADERQRFVDATLPFLGDLYRLAVYLIGDRAAAENITEREWTRMVAIFKEVLAKHRVPAKGQQELLDIVGSTKADIVVTR